MPTVAVVPRFIRKTQIFICKKKHKDQGEKKYFGKFYHNDVLNETLYYALWGTF